jgi:hypothetical protein
VHTSGRKFVFGLAWLAAAGAWLNAEADVRRRITVRSNPEGALVYIDDQQIGATPVSVSFVYYGTRKIQLIKDGFKTITVKETFSPPWYEIPPLDFFSENVYGGELRDERVLDFQMEPETIPPTNELWQRAEALRSSARAGPIALPPPGTALGAAPPLAPPLAPPPALTAPSVIAAPPPVGQPLMRLPPPTQVVPNPLAPASVPHAAPFPYAETIPAGPPTPIPMLPP